MAGPSVAVRVIGDLSNFAKSMGDTATHGESAASRLRGAFTGAIGAFNQTGVLGPFGDALSGVDQALGSIIEHGKNIGPAMLGAGTAIAGVGAGLTTLGSKDQAAHQQLQASVEATGKSYDDYSDQVEKAIGHQEKYGDTANQTQDALRVMTQAFQDPQKALDELGTASDLAAAKHEDLSTAAGQLAKAAAGSGRILKELGISQKDAAGNAKSHDEILKEISDRLSGQASASADTFSGKLKSLKATVEDQVSQFGQKYGPALTAAGSAMAGMGAAIQVASVAQGIFNAVMAANPIILVVLAIAALIAALILAYQHVGWFRAAVQDFASIAVAAFNWIWNAVQVVFGWIVDHWQLLLTILTGPIGVAVWLITSNFDTIKRIFSDAVDFIINVWNGVKDFFGNLGGWLSTAMGTVKDILVAPFKAAFNAIGDIWNNTVGKLSFDIPGWVPGLGGKGFSMPQIPHWAAQGGIFTGPQIIGVGEAGPEAVIPLDRMPGLGGPAVVIENATFAQQMDVDLFMQRVAWHAQTSMV